MSEYLSIDPATLSTGQIHKYLLTAIAPRPIALASTIDKNGKVNLSPFSFFNVFSANPPIMIFSPARRGRDNTVKHTYENVMEVREVSINIVTYDIVQQVSLSSTEYDKGVNEFEKSGLSEIPSSIIHPPRVKESPVSFECIVDDVIELGTEGGAGILVLSRVVKIHLNKEYLNEDSQLIPEKMDLVGRMGGPWYTRTNEASMFQIPKPLSSKGIGVDQLPLHVRNSKILTGNDLGLLGNQAELPTGGDLARWSHIQSKELMEVHSMAKSFIENRDIETALQILLSYKV